ncbi:alpha/beta fold hydrolase [Xylophilus sp. Kf1]|nr:alpha/beta fold hydrolase [Xylophilus sp. Kf1]
MFEGFVTHDVAVDGATIHALVGGHGPAVLLLHGHPQTHAMWHRVAEGLAMRFTVVVADLRGYGDSSRPAAGIQNIAYSKRVMAQDMVQLMSHLGFERFLLGAHDRGARVAHRLALDHPERVEKLMLLDIAPTLDMYAGTDEAFARAYWHWFFLIQPAPLPERLIEADPVAYVREVMGRRHAGLAPFAPGAMADYERCIAIPGSAAALCADYRASAGIDLDHDREDRDAGHRLTMPVRVMWGADGVVHRCFDVMALWQAQADDLSGALTGCGHYLAEEDPAAVLAQMHDFFRSEKTGLA